MQGDLYGIPFTLIHVIGRSRTRVKSFAESVSNDTSFLVPEQLDGDWAKELREEGRELEDLSFDLYDTFEQKQTLFVDGKLSCTILCSVLETEEWCNSPLSAAVWRFTATPPQLQQMSTAHPDLTFLVTWLIPTEEIAEAGFSEWHKGEELQTGALSIDAGRHIFMQFAHAATTWNFSVNYGTD